MAISSRQNILLFGAVALPSALVVALGLWMIQQEDELERTRRREQREQSIELVRQELLNRLEGLKLRAATRSIAPRDADVALVARVEARKLVLPWDEPAPTDQGALFAQLRDPDGASKLLKGDPALADEYGVPFTVYAARRMMAQASPADQLEIQRQMADVLDEAWLSPTGAYMLAEVATELDSDPLRAAAAQRVAEAEQAGQLSREVIALDDPGGEPIWRLYGKLPWLVGITGRPGDERRTLVAVRAQPLLDSVRLPEEGRWILAESEGEGMVFGESFPGLRFVLTETPTGGYAGSRRILYYAGLLLVTTVTIFAAYLLHRDVRRETRLATLRSQFVSSVSHELKTPIASMRAFAELLDMGRVRNEQERAEYVRAILGESERLSRQVDGVLEFSRMEQGQRVYRLQPVALEEVLNAAAKSLEYSLAQGGFELQIKVDPHVPQVTADRDAIEQAIMNLLSNAMKYSDGDRRIEASLVREQNNAVIRVRDQGIGIPVEEQSRIFERFHRAPEAGQRNIPGTGLGLALVDHIVKAHGGRVAVESLPGGGSTFSISLPVAGTA